MIVETYLLIFFATSGYRSATPPATAEFAVEAECWQALIDYAVAKETKEYEANQRWGQRILADPDTGRWQRSEVTQRLSKAERDHSETLARYVQRRDLPGTCVKRSQSEAPAS